MIRFLPMYVDVSVVVSAAPVRRTKARAKASVASSEISTTKGVSFRGFVITNPRKDTPFVVLISLLATLALARAFVLLTGAAETTTETSTYIGRNLIIGGYHIHHFFYGFALICAAAWIPIQYPTRNLPRLAAVLFGGGPGLCVDEIGFFLGGQVNYFDRTTYFIATSIILVLLAALSFRS